MLRASPVILKIIGKSIKIIIEDKEICRKVLKIRKDREFRNRFLKKAEHKRLSMNFLAFIWKMMIEKYFLRLVTRSLLLIKKPIIVKIK